MDKYILKFVIWARKNKQYGLEDLIFEFTDGTEFALKSDLILLFIDYLSREGKSYYIDEVLKFWRENK